MGEKRNVDDLFPRAPRYVIEWGDNEVVRFALKPRGSKTMYTRIINISESGMAFLVPFSAAPSKGAEIKIEFNAPNTPQIACFALVKRVQIHRTYNQEGEPQRFKLIAVEFIDLPDRQRELLAKGLNQQFLKKKLEYQKQQFWLGLRWWAKYFLSSLTKVFQLLIPKWPWKKKSSQDIHNIPFVEIQDDDDPKALP